MEAPQLTEDQLAEVRRLAMEAHKLTEDQLAEVRRFFDSDACRRLWESLEAQIMAKWLLATDTASREECWVTIQAVLALQSTLRDASANTRLNLRAKENVSRTPGYGSRSQS